MNGLQYENQGNLDEQVMYYRYVIRLVSETGVQNNSTISVPFDPSFQSLSFHRIQVKRGGRIFNRLKGAKFTVLHQESELKGFIYSGNVSAVLILTDIRK